MTHRTDRPRSRAAGQATRSAILVLLIAVGLAACGSAEEPNETGAEPSSGTSQQSSATTSASPSPSATPSAPTPSASSPSASSPSTTTEPTPSGPTLEVGIDGDEVTPNAAEVDLAVGEPLTINFDTDRGGELHVHSKPEQYVEFKPGRSTQELVIETPGSVEIEEHDTEAVVAVVQVR